MLVKLNDVLNYAKENKCAIGAYNTPTFENLFAVIRAAEKKKCTNYNHACGTS